DEPPDERERGVGHFAPAAVDDEGVTAVGHLDDPGDGLVALLLLERRVRDRPRDGVVLFAATTRCSSSPGQPRATLAHASGLSPRNDSSAGSETIFAGAILPRRTGG